MSGDKASRILDAAEALLIAFGYRKVTIDDVASRAAVGKGTLYLYWPSKRELFAAVLTRDTARRVTDLLAALDADPAEVRLHRGMRWAFVATMRRPLAKAMATADRDVLGDILTTNDTGSRLTLGQVETTAAYLALLHRHGLLTDDPRTDRTVLHRLSTLMLGTYRLSHPELTVDDQADALVTTVRRAFEPAGEPSAAAVRAARDDLADLYWKWHAELVASLPAA